MNAKPKIGYFVPEFPAQTHAFFWRELQALKKIGLEVDLISTKKPSERLISHSWAKEAISLTTYLFPPRVIVIFRAVVFIVFAGFSKWRQLVAAIFGAETVGIKGRVRHGILAIFGAVLSERSRDQGWCHIHVHSCADSANIARYAHLLSGLSYSLTLHGHLHIYGLNQREKWKNAAFCIAVADVLMEEVESKLNGYLPPIFKKAPMGVNTMFFYRHTLYAPWCSGETCKVVSCGRLNPGKRHDDTIRAVSLLKKKGIDINLRIAGEDDTPGSATRTHLEQLIQQLSLTQNVSLLGAISEKQVRSELEAAHLFVISSEEEALPVAIMEAMAMGVPLVATRVGGVPELVEHGKNGLMVKPFLPEEIAEAMEMLLLDPKLTKKMSVASQKKIEASFHERISAETIASLLKATGVLQ